MNDLGPNKKNALGWTAKQSIFIDWLTVNNHGISELGRMPELIKPNHVRGITEGTEGNTKHHRAQSWFWGNFYWRDIQIHTYKRLLTVGGREKSQVGKTMRAPKSERRVWWG